MRAAFTTDRPTRAGARGAHRGIGAGGDRDADAGKTEDQPVGLLPLREPAAFAHRVADIAEHEQVAERGAGEADEIVRLTRDQAARESCRPWRPRVFSALTASSTFCDELRIDRDLPVEREVDEALREFGILRRQRRLDFARRDRGVERASRVSGPQARPDRPAIRSQFTDSIARGNSTIAPIRHNAAAASDRRICQPRRSSR